MQTFKILDKTWELHQVSPTDKNPMTTEYHLGMCFMNLRQIYINKDLPIEVKWEVLAHELTHAFLDTTQLTEKEEFTEEELCEFVAKFSGSIMRLSYELVPVNYDR